MKIKTRHFLPLLPLLAIFSVFLTACTSLNSDDISLLDTANSGKISPIGETLYDWKDIQIDGGDVEHTFSLKNSGEEDLILKGAETSCMCTSATYLLPNGETSTAFGMHNNTAWTYRIHPGEEFKVHVIFDPMAHGPEATGPVGRTVYLTTSSIPNGEFAKENPRAPNSTITELTLKANVL